MRRLLLIALALIITLCAFASAQDAPDYGGTYTPEELAALDQALWAGNMTRADMGFKKDYTDGTGCFPIVRELMDDPLSIAPWMDQAAVFQPRGLGTPREPFRALMNSWTEFGTGSAEDKMIHRSLFWSLYEDANLGYGFHFDTRYITGEEIVNAFSDMLQAELSTTEAEYEIQHTPMAHGYSYLWPRDWSYVFGWKDSFDYAKYPAIRNELPASLAWHDVFTRPFAVETTDEPLQIYSEMENFGVDALIKKYMWHFRCLGPGFWKYLEQRDLLENPEVKIIDTPGGRICIGTPGDDYYEGDFVVLIEPGGNDTYHNCRIGAAYGSRSYGPRLGPDGEPTGASADYSPLGDGTIGYFCDLGGDDFYDCADVDITLGAAVLGVAAFYDLGGGNDRYYAGFCSLGAAMGGVATFYDDGGCDYYSGKAFTQGAAGFGVGIMLDDSVSDAPVFDTAEGNEGVIDSYETGESDKDVHTLMDNDYYTAWEGAQAFARPRGVALCINRRGNEVYHAGGVYLHAPLFADRYHSFSQGFAIGERGEDWAGGIAMLIDYDGNDRYLGDIYSQGVGYWYGAGLLWDGGGNDTYEMTQYGQGSGIHLAVGGLVDCAGSDTYVMHAGLGQGGSHDLAASILHDRGGDDHYMGTTTCNGAALTGSVGIHIDRSGNDIYAGRANNGVNHTDGRAHNVGVLVDMDGDDEYLGIQDDGLATLMRNLSMSLDTAPPPPPEAEGDEDAAQDSDEGADVPLPEVISYEGDLTQEVFDELWEIACRWEVGDNREIVPKARERLIAFGPEMLPLLEPKMNEDYSLNMRAYVGVLKPMYEGEYAEDVAALLMRQAQTEDEARNNVALYVIGELKVAEAESIVAQFVAERTGSIQRRAMGVLASLGSHAADDQLLALLLSSDEPQLKSALAAVISLKIDCYPELQPLLSHPLVSVRELLVEKLAGNWDTYSEMILADLESEVGQTGVRKVRSIMHILAKLSDPPTARQVLDTAAFLQSDDWGLQGDCIRLFKQWSRLEDVPMDVSAELDAMRNSIKTIDVESAHPYVRYWLEKE